MRVLLALLLIAGPLVSSGWAQVSFPTRPPSGGIIVSDEIGLIRVEQRQEIERIGTALFKETGFPVAVVTIKALAAQRASGYPIERYASEMLASWKLEPVHRSHGMLLLVAGIVSLGRSGRKSWAWAITGLVGAIVLSRAIAYARGGGSSSTDDSGVTGKW